MRKSRSMTTSGDVTGGSFPSRVATLLSVVT